jgi:hypothetical protein
MFKIADQAKKNWKSSGGKRSKRRRKGSRKQRR